MESGGSIERRGRALENEFFHRVDQELLAKLHAKLQHQDRKQSLAAVCGWASDALLDKLVDANVTAQSLVAMTLYPLVRTAWADRKMEPVEKAAILRAASEHCAPDSVAYHLLESWVQSAPPSSLFDAWRDYTRAFCATLAPEARQEFRDDLLRQTRQIAQAAGGFLGLGAVSPGEERALQEIEATLCSAESP